MTDSYKEYLKRFAINLISEKGKDFKDLGDGSFHYDYYGSNISYVLVEETAHISCSMRDGEILTFKINRQIIGL